MPRGLVAMARSGGHCPLRVSGGILCSERGQSRDVFQAIPLEETSPRCNKIVYQKYIGTSIDNDNDLFLYSKLMAQRYNMYTTIFNIHMQRKGGKYS